MIDGEPAYLYLPSGTRFEGLSGTTFYILKLSSRLVEDETRKRQGYNINGDLTVEK